MEIERKALLELPAEDFAFFNRSIRKVALNCLIYFENNYYSVPFRYVGEDVTIRWNEHMLRIISGGEEVALHHKAEGKGNYVIVRAHFPDNKVYSESEQQLKYEEKMRGIGEDAHEYFRWLLARKEPYWFQIVRGILGLNQTYGNEAVNKALKRAMYYQVRNVGTIRHVLEKKLYLEELEPKLLDTEMTVFMREDNPLCRDLSYYSVHP